MLKILTTPQLQAAGQIRPHFKHLQFRSKQLHSGPTQSIRPVPLKMMVTLGPNQLPLPHHQPASGDIVEVEWDAVVQKFHQAFRETFSRSKKAHFDFLPPELRVVDGARDRWYPLLLLDAAWGLLWSNDFQFASKKAFNQRKVLYDSIVCALRGSLLAVTATSPAEEESASPGWQWPPVDHATSLLPTSTSENATMYAFTEDGSIRRVVHTLKDPVAFACAKDAARSFSNLRTVFALAPTLPPGRRVGASTTGGGQSSATSRTYCFPSPFASHGAMSSRPTAAAVSFDEEDGWDDDANDALYGRASPWSTVRGFEALALSDPPAKSRSRFEAAVTLLAAHALPLGDTDDNDDVAVRNVSGDDELDALLHLVVCKVLWHEAFVRRDETLRVAVRRLMATSHRPPSSHMRIDDGNNDCGSRSTAVSPLLWWVSTEETHMDDVRDARRQRDTAAAATTDAARASIVPNTAVTSTLPTVTMRKRRRDERVIESSAEDSDSDSDGDSDASGAKKRRVGDSSDADGAAVDDEDIFMASFTAATHALDLWTPL